MQFTVSTSIAKFGVCAFRFCDVHRNWSNYHHVLSAYDLAPALKCVVTQLINMYPTIDFMLTLQHAISVVAQYLAIFLCNGTKT